MRRCFVAALLVLVIAAAPGRLTLARPAAAISGNGWLTVTERVDDSRFRVTPDPTGGLWVQRSDGIHHRSGDGPGFEGAALAPYGGGHLATDPRSGDLVEDASDGITRITKAGSVSVITPTHGDTSTIDVARDGTIWFNDADGLHRVSSDGTRTDVRVSPSEVNAVVAMPDGSLVYAAAAALFRWDGTTSTRIAGTYGVACLPPDPCGDGGPASDAGLGFVNQLDTDDQGSTILIGEYFGRVRAIGDDGIIRAVTGGWQRCYLARVDCGEGSGAQLALLDNVLGMAVSGSKLYVVDQSGASSATRLITVDPWTVRLAPPEGYRMIATDGGVFTFGWGTFQGSTGNLRLVSPIVAGASNGTHGYWFVAGDGGVFTFGDAGFYGSASGATSSPVVDMARTPTGRGYWLLERDGAVHAFGDARDCRGLPSQAGPFAAIVGAPNGTGYALVADDGRQYGVCARPGGPVASLPKLNAPLVAAHRTASGDGLWMVAADGGVFTQGDAGFFGSTGGMRLNQPVLDLIPTPSEQGYWLIARDGGVFTFGDAQFDGSMGAIRLNQPVVAGFAGPQSST